MVYSNADENKLQILLDNKGKTGIYQWTHKESALAGRLGSFKIYFKTL